MSLKGVELQIAIPKTFDAGKVAEQLQQQNNISQANAQAATERQLEKNRETVLQSSESAKLDEHDPRNQQGQQQQKRNKKKQQQKNSKHPFKGNFVDFSG